jgi:SsrA-binding protein
MIGSIALDLDFPTQAEPQKIGRADKKGILKNMKILAENRRIRFEYEIIETVEAGIELKGFEVKAVKAGRASITGAFARAEGTTLWLLGADIPPYQPDNTPREYDQKRARRLLVKRKEAGRLAGKRVSERLTIIPTKMYSKRGLIKIELALARPKKLHDKRETIKRREANRTIERTLKQE